MAEQAGTAGPERAHVLALVQRGLRQAAAHLKWLRRLDTWLLVTSIVLGALATVLAGGAAAAGEGATNLAGSWQAICIGIAVITALGTVCGTLHKTFRVSDRLGAAVACQGKLQALELSLALTGKDPVEAAQVYEQILREHPECLAA